MLSIAICHLRYDRYYLSNERKRAEVLKWYVKQALQALQQNAVQSEKREAFKKNGFFFSKFYDQNMYKHAVNRIFQRKFSVWRCLVNAVKNGVQ